MNKRPIAVTVAVLLTLTLVLPPLAIPAGRGQGGAGGGMGHVGVGGPGGFQGPHGFGGGHPGFGPHSFHHPSFHPHPFFKHGFGRVFPFGFTVPVVSYGWPYGWPYGSYGWPYFYGSALSPDPPPYYGGYGGSAYGAPVAYPSAPASAAPTVYSVNIYNPPPTVAQPVVQPAIVQPAIYEPPSAAIGVPAPSPQGVVEYEGGRYELRGDGMTIAYKWVWIPNPPPGPPGSSAMRAPAAGELAPARRGTIYRWVDDQGILHVTDRWQAVPQRYRDQAKQNLDS